MRGRRHPTRTATTNVIGWGRLSRLLRGRQPETFMRLQHSRLLFLFVTLARVILFSIRTRLLVTFLFA